ncbi:MAG: glycosyltransferase family 39 protein [Pseudomonadota bacterium]|nr:glycosyltransferase family 39 protein [Pseudomonadota bacterium]
MHQEHGTPMLLHTTNVPALSTDLDRRPPRRVAGWLVLLCLLFFLPGFTSLPPTDRDESRFAQASRQMWQSGDWVTIRFQDDERNRKPAGVYWLQAASARILAPFAGEQAIWPYRIPSLLGAIAAVLLTYQLGQRLFSRPVAALSALFLASSVLLGVEARLAKTDAVLLAVIVLAQGCLARLYLDPKNKPSPIFWAVLFWIAQGLGILIKGPIICAISGLTVAWLTITDDNRRWLRSLRPGWGLLIVAGLVLPWIIAISIATEGRFVRDALLGDLLAKVPSGQESHGAAPGSYLLSFALTFWPASLFALVATPWVWRSRNDPAVRFCIAWLLPTWLMLELVATKLPHYILPVFPAASLLVAAALASPKGTWQAAAPGARVLAGAFGAFGGSALIALCVAIPWHLGFGIPVASLFTVATVILGSLAIVYALKDSDGRRLFRWTSVTAIAFAMSFYLGLLPRLTPLWISPRIAESLQAHELASDRVTAVGYHEPSLVFLLGRSTQLAASTEAAAKLLGNGNAKVALIPRQDAQKFLELLKERGLGATWWDEIRGFNYNGGDWMDLAILALDRPNHVHASGLSHDNAETNHARQSP